MPPRTDAPEFHCETLAIVGVGLMGAAIAREARRQGAAAHIVGLGRDPARLAAARHSGVIDEALTSPEGLRNVGLAVICTPVDRIEADVRSLLVSGGGPRLITDAGSVKAAITRNLRDVPRFVGAHPLAGSEKRGHEHAHEVQLQDRVCVVTPEESTPSDMVDEIRAFWTALGMRVLVMPADDHDAILARTSHLPHLAAYALASLLEGNDIPFAATGFRDSTRIAASDPKLWSSILMLNRDAVRSALAAYRRTLDAADALLQSGGERELTALLAEAQQARLRLEPPAKPGVASGPR
ncbi:MAG: prephenate dehydrogenase [Planctomyces sp.]|nr:prephenate dehydrogenase [Planctomyces sp.]